MSTARFVSDQILSEALALAAVPAPPGSEAERRKLVEGALHRVPGWATWQDDVGNLITTPANDPTEHAAPADAVWLLVHMDSVFPIETKLELERTAQIARGPGIGDNALAVAAALAVVRAFELREAQHSLVVAFTVGEESHGNLKGARQLLAGAAAIASVVLAIEGHRGEELGVEMPASSRFTLEITAPGGHSWWDRGRPSALHELIHFASELIALAPKHCPGVSVNVGTLRGGSGVTAIAGHAEAAFEGRSVSSEQVDAFAALAERLSAGLDLAHTLREIGRRPGGVLQSDHPLIAMAQAARAEAGVPLAILGSSSSDANPFIHAGIPALTVGITTGRNAHQLDEEIDIAPIASGTGALFHLAKALCRNGEAWPRAHMSRAEIESARRPPAETTSQSPS